MDAASNKHVRLGVASAAVPVSSVRKRQAFADVNSRQDVAAGADAASLDGLQTAKVEFTKEEVEALLNYKPKKKKFDHEANAELMSEDNKRLRRCIKWFQTVEETHLTEQQVLRSALDSAEKKCIETEIQLAKRLEELDGVIAGLRNDNLSLQEQLAKETSEKPESINCHLSEKEGRMAAEKLQANLLIASQNDMYKILQEFNKRLQQYDSELSDSDDSLKRVENEKLPIVENLGALRSHYTALQDQPASCKTIEATHLTEQQVLRSALESAEKKCIETEIQMAKRLEELDGVIAGLRNDNLSLQEQLAKESSEKREAINCHLREMERRIVAEKLQATLLEDLEKCKQEILAADRQIATQNVMYKRVQEYNTSLQQYNSKSSDSNDSLKRVENEKLSIVENVGALSNHYTALQEQPASCKETCLAQTIDSTGGEECPSFEVIISKSAAEGKYLHVPHEFSSSHLKGPRLLNATLKFSQRSWQIVLIDYRKSYRMMDGWGIFTRDNYLRMGDSCTFKLVDKIQLVFEVSISKH